MNQTVYTKMGYTDHIIEVHSSTYDFDNVSESESEDEQEAIERFHVQLQDAAYNAYSKMRDRIEELSVPIGELLTETAVYDFIQDRV